MKGSDNTMEEGKGGGTGGVKKKDLKPGEA